MRRCDLNSFKVIKNSKQIPSTESFLENTSSPVFAFFSKIIRFYFIGVFPDFLDTLDVFYSSKFQK
jgi:hypothetical protein